MLKQRLEEDFKKAVTNLDLPVTDIVISIPKNPAFGDYSTNLALQLAKLHTANGKQSALEIAKKILGYLGHLSYLEKVEVAGGGFINFFLKDEALLTNLSHLGNLGRLEKGEKIMVEYGHTNPLKEVHIGHLRTFILGESLSRILESVGNQVFRANYQGDIGLHVAKAIWGMQKLGLPSQELSLAEKAQYMGKAYAEGNKAYEDDPGFKKEIEVINTALYKLPRFVSPRFSLKSLQEQQKTLTHDSTYPRKTVIASSIHPRHKMAGFSASDYQKDKQFNKIYQMAREWSLDYFEPIYKLLGIKYDRCFFESEVFARGKEIVLEHLGKVFVESDGAIIFPGEKWGLHNRVFVTSAHHPTYEGKEMGLAEEEYAAFKYDKAIHIVAHEQAGYFEVVFKAIGMIFPDLKDKKYHLSYGLVDLKEGKMSSRTGTVVTVDDLYKVVSERVREVMKQSKSSIDQEIVRQVAMGAIKFAYLKFSPAPNMVFDLEESVSLDGDSGPYVQYTYARIQSVLKRCFSEESKSFSEVKLDRQERALLRQFIYFQDVVLEVAASYHPNLLATYLIELSKLYNLFYQECRIIGSDKEQFRLKLSDEVGKVLKQGLDLLGIEAPERM